MNAYAKIRAALEMSKRASRYCVLPGLERKTDEAMAALADLERAASDPVMWQYLDTQHVQIDPPPPSDVWRALYAAPPVSAGMFTAEQMRAVKFETNELWDALTSALQWLRNIRDGISTPETAIENTEAMIAHCREVEERTK